MAALAEVGPGDLSVDRKLGIDVSGPLTAAAAVGSGTAAALVAAEPEESAEQG